MKNILTTIGEILLGVIIATVLINGATGSFKSGAKDVTTKAGTEVTKVSSFVNN